MILVKRMKRFRITLFLTVLWLAGCASQPILQVEYDQSVASAAIRSSSSIRKLEPFDTSAKTVIVAHLQKNQSIDNRHFIWVVHPEELKSFCHGKPDPLLSMEQALGLPPDLDPAYRVFTIKVSPRAMFRPCASGFSIATESCGLELPVNVNPKNAGDEHFVLKQMMDSYRGNRGYPFTAMGWSYDWDPASVDHQGISEYVMKPRATITLKNVEEPVKFCSNS